MRSRRHTLTVAADRLEQECANPLLIKELRKLAKEVDARGTAEDERRAERQRTLFGALPSCNATDRLKASMLQRAYDMLWDGNCDGCDALLEFLPSGDARKMLDAWSDDQVTDDPSSKWYRSAAE